MKSILSVITFLIITFSFESIAQDHFQILNDVPDDFKKRYYQQAHEFNPLHVGDIWQYSFEDSDIPYRHTRIIQDSIINGKQYFKKIHFWNYLNTDDAYYIWERNDSTKLSSYMVDIEDHDKDGDSTEEFLVDSLEVRKSTDYISYKFCFKEFDYMSTRALVSDSGWVLIWGDIVLYRSVEYINFFTGMWIADKYGVLMYWTESPPNVITGAIIDGIEYGNIVSVKDTQPVVYEDQLTSIYPNPFNSRTTISYTISKSTPVKILIFNILGEHVTDLVNKDHSPGIYTASFESGDLPSGIYVCALITNFKAFTTKMIILK